MKFQLAPKVASQLKKIKRKNPKLFAKVQKQLKLFKQNHRHPSLRNHKLKGDLSDTWSISIEGNVRLLYYVSGTEAIFFTIGTHQEVYGKK